MGKLARWCARISGAALVACGATRAPPAPPPKPPKPILGAPLVSQSAEKRIESAKPVAKPIATRPRAPRQDVKPWYPKAPTVLAPLGPYPEWSAPLPADCVTPYVLAASAPAKMATQGEWFWPWVVQTLLAHDHSLQLVASLDHESATSRAVRLQELIVPGKGGKSSLSLAVQCKTLATCVDVARVIGAAVPSSKPQLSCSLPPGEPSARAPSALEKIKLLRAPDEPLTDVGSACARLSACLRHEDEHADPALGLKCQATPNAFPVRCSAQYTCYDVAECAGAKKSDGPVFSPFADVWDQVHARAERVGAGQGVPDPMGGGGIDPSVANACFSYDPEKGTGAWAALLLSFSGSDRSKEGYYQSGSGIWAAAFIEPNGVAHLGPARTVTATLYNSVGIPGGGPDEVGEFDFDNDGLNELLLPTHSVEHANSGFVAYEVWTRRGGVVKPYAPATFQLSIVHFEDEDNDGRIDLYLDTEGDLDMVGTHSSRRPEAWLLAHSLKDGSFSTTDRVAQSYNDAQAKARQTQSGQAP